MTVGKKAACSVYQTVATRVASRVERKVERKVACSVY